MAGIVICGGGVCGLLTAMLLARDGHEVTVLERDPAPPAAPEEAWENWERRGVNQFRLPHFLLPKFHELASAELPDVVAALDAAGAYRFNVVTGLSGGALPPDPGFDVITARRPVVEAAVARAAEETPGVVIRRGVATGGLVTGRAAAAAGVPHVTGLETTDGETINADLVVDAMGRRSPLMQWLAAIGAPPAQFEEEDSGFVYYGRHVRSRDGRPVVPAPSNTLSGSVSLLALPADGGTAGVGVIASAGDAALRVLRQEEPWRRVVATLPGGERILDCEPISPLVSMAKIEDRWRRFAVDGMPVATGVVAVADSWAATNPSLGRGISLGFMHAVALRDTVRKEGLDSPLALLQAFDAVTDTEFTPWYRSTVWLDRHTIEVMEASIEDRPNGVGDDPLYRDWLRLQVLAREDPAVLPRFLASGLRLAERPEHVVADPAIRTRLEASSVEPVAAPGPSRAQLLAACRE